MEAKEIRIGNWINFKYKDKDWGEATINANFFRHYEYEDYNYTPIPLTEEWLVKFGFDEGEYEFYLSPNAETIGLGISKDMIADFGGTGIIRVEYVHQLQNLFYALCGEELTIKDHE